MEEFNFDAPFSTMVIFDDSDEATIEIEPSIGGSDREAGVQNDSFKTISEPKIKEISFNRILPENSKDTSLPQIHFHKPFENAKIEQNVKESTECEEITHPTIKNHIPNTKPLDMPSLEEDRSNSYYLNSSTNTKVKKAKRKNGIGCKKEKKRMKTINGKISKWIKSETKKSNEENNPIDEPNSLEIQKQDSSTIKIDQNINLQSTTQIEDVSNAEALSPKSPIQNDQAKEHFIVDIKTSPSKLSARQQNTGVLSQSLMEINQSFSNYLNDLLNTVSEHLIYIINSYQSYARVYKANNDPKLIEHAKHCFIRTRNHLFDLSYSSVVNVILPRMDDVTFVKNFIANTSQLAQSKSFNYSCALIEPLYLDMIAWVKKKREQLQNMNVTISNPMLAQELRKPLPQNKFLYPNQDLQIKDSNPTLSGNNLQNNPSSRPPGQINTEQTHSKQQKRHKQTYYSAVQELQKTKSPNEPALYVDQHILQPNTEFNRNYDTPSFGLPGENTLSNEITYSNQQSGFRQLCLPVTQDWQKAMAQNKPPPPYSSHSNPIHKLFPTSNRNHTQLPVYPKENTLVMKSTYLNQQNGQIQHQCCSSRQEAHPLKQPNNVPSSYSNKNQQLHKLSTTTNNNYIQSSRPPGQNMYSGPIYLDQQNRNLQPFCPTTTVVPQQNTRGSYGNQIYNGLPKVNTPFQLTEALNSFQNELNNQQSHQSISKIQKLTQLSSHQKQVPTSFKKQDWQKNKTNSWQGDIPTVQNYPRNNQEIDSSQSDEHVRSENLIQVESSRSSVSRDSGFMSPLHFQSFDQLCNVQEEQSQATPLITHVTSLNPNVSYIMEGCCVVCRKSTKQKCIGCFNCYYCSHECQNTDWKNHQAVCKNI